jgi:hypothetical protein
MITAGTFIKPIGGKFKKMDFTRDDGIHAVYDFKNIEIHAAYDKFSDDLFVEMCGSKLGFKWFNNVSKNIDQTKRDVENFIL